MGSVVKVVLVIVRASGVFGQVSTYNSCLSFAHLSFCHQLSHGVELTGITSFLFGGWLLAGSGWLWVHC
jgi:hypothetical protein